MAKSRQMRQRLRDALRRGRSSEPPHRQYRPNELRLDVVRAERLRREARWAEPAASRPARSLEELQVQERGPREPLPTPAVQSRPVPSQIAALKTRSGLRQAWLLKEILGPPLALRGPFGDDEP
jgi:hypothetical protein